MTLLMLPYLWFSLQAPDIASQGYLSAYAPGVAERVLDKRVRLYGLADDYIPSCLIALNTNQVGRYARVDYEDGTWLLCYVVDCAAPVHGRTRERLRLVGEVDATTFARFGNGPAVIRVLGQAGAYDSQTD